MVKDFQIFIPPIWGFGMERNIIYVNHFIPFVVYSISLIIIVTFK